MYTTIALIKLQFPQFTAAQWGTGFLPTDAAIEAEIISASRRVDDFLRAIYVLPFEPDTPETIVTATLQIVVAVLRRNFTALSPETDKQGPDLEKAAHSALRAMGEGHPPFLEWPLDTVHESPRGVPISADPPLNLDGTIHRLLPRDQVY